MQGHDHTYARGRNLPFGGSEKDDKNGTVYVVSVSGTKMYNLTDNRWMDRAGENTQLYQIVAINKDTLRYEAKTVLGNLYDSFELIKQKNGFKEFVDKTPEDIPERRFEK